ncbi:predicted protein [Naegleria gruberi]|uniref:Predicted protein n=1 Tax=Naegleria gruberi TaxID=5762 RepID=D2V7P6_NAEGR|nr:uncharacterized protein NAEGRDRAFT_64881 [Naegleria gruberi]EFC47038.1 predicted protein [Naegleria gruberi]|eukprot:XP_002679782.1 predicted protein [Naegleria gruberi strain NEG-M]
MVDLHRAINTTKSGLNHVKYEQGVSSEKFIPQPFSANHQHSINDRILMKLLELWSEVQSFVQHFNSTLEEHHRKVVEKEVLKCEYLASILDEVFEYVLSQEEIHSNKVISGKANFNMIKQVVADLNLMDLKQLVHRVDNLGKDVDKGKEKIDLLINELSIFNSVL